MSQGVSHYPLSQLISRIIADSGLSRAHFVASLGYRNVQKGLHRLDAWLDDGEGDPGTLERIVAAYSTRFGPLEIVHALAATAVIKRAEVYAAEAERLKIEHERFRPCILVEGEHTVPSGITIFAVTGGDWNLIELPEEIVNLPLAEQMPALAELMRAYLEGYEGDCPFFGKVTGFRLVRWHESVRFTTTGEFIEVVPGRFRGGQTTLTIGHKTVEIAGELGPEL
jgi:hypothetical protein